MSKNIQKTQRFKGHSKEIRLISVLFIMLFLTSFASATLKSYDEVNKEVTLSSNFLFFNTGDIAKIQLKSNLNEQVGLGYQKVFQFEINSYQEYNNFLKGFEIYNLNRGNKLENKKIDLKYLTYKTIKVPITKEVCSETKNGTSCLNKETGEYEEKKVEYWEDLTTTDVKIEKLTISGWTNVNQGDNYEWIPNFAGAKVNEWATWTGNMSVGLVSYYKLDETTGTTAYDSLGLNNGTNTNIGFTTGIIGGAYSFNGTSYITIPDGYFGSGESKYSVSYWFEETNKGTYRTIFGKIQSSSVRNAIFQSDGKTMIFFGSGNFASFDTPINNVYFLTLVFDGTQTGNENRLKLYINGSQQNLSFSGTIPSANQDISSNLVIGKYSSDTGISGWVDEVGIWNRSLSQTEITLLYNHGSGCAYGNESCYTNIPTVVQNSPADSYKSASRLVTFNFTVSSAIDLANTSLIIDGDIVSTNTSGIKGVYIFNYTFPSDGDFSWKARACNADGCVNTSSRTIGVDTVAPQFTINYPTPIIDYGYVNQTMQLNWSVGDDNLDKVWYNYNGTNITITGAISGTYNLSNITLSSKKNVTFYANDTYGNMNSTVWSWDYGVFENGRSYQTSNYETNSSLFTLNITRASGYNILYPYLNYNGVDYLINNISNSGSNSILYKTIYLPLNTGAYSTQNNTLYWKMNSTNGVTTYPITTTSSNQTVNPLILTLCNATYPVKALNFTGYDEQYQTNLVPITFDGAFNYYIGDGSIVKDYYYQNLTTGTSNWNFCISPNTTIQTNMQSSFTNSNYLPRTYYLSNASLTNTSSNIKILMLNASTGIKFYFTLEEGGIRVGNATITISKKNIGTGLWDVIGIRHSDSLGEFIEYLELDKEHSYSIVKDGTPLGIIYKTSSCSTSPCLVTLSLDDGVSYNQWAGYYNEYAQNVVYSLDYYPTEKIINYTFLDITGLANYFRLQVDRLNFENASTNICNTTLYATQGTITCNVTGQTGNFIATGTISRSPEKIVAVITGILSSIADAIGKNLGLFIAVLLIIVVGVAGSYNPVVGIVLTAVALVLSVIIGLVSISLTSIVLIIILAITLVIKNGRYNV